MTTDIGVVQWYYGNEDKRSEERFIEWIKYRDIEIEIIETAYQQRKSEVFWDKYRIDFNKLIQYSRVDATEQYPVKRQTNCHREDCLREERFFSQAPLTSTTSYGSAQAWCPFLSAWHNTSAGKKALFDFSSAIDTCADGILQEAASSSSDSQTEFIGTVYRGLDLSPATIISYKQAQGMWRTWLSFTSTSKNKKMAEIRGNTLFIITISNTQFSSPVRACDISDILQFPSGEEVLLPAGISFQVIRVDENSYQKNIIEIKI